LSEGLDIRVVWIGPGDPQLPSYQTSGAAGMDLLAAQTEALTIQPGQRLLIPTGIKMELPQGFEAQIRPRSGLAYKHGLTVLNAPGTIDSDYRGEVKVLIAHLGDEPYTIQPFERIAQMVIAPVVRAYWKLSETLDDSERGQGGFGSTGS